MTKSKRGGLVDKARDVAGEIIDEVKSTVAGQGPDSWQSRQRDADHPGAH